MDGEPHKPVSDPSGSAPTTPHTPQDGPRYLAPTTIQLYADCPRKYAYRHLERAPAEFYASAFAFGRALHATVEDVCGPTSAGRLDLERAEVVFLRTFRKECSENPVRFEAGDSMEASERLGLHLVRVLTAHLPIGEVTSAEVPFEVPLANVVRHARPPVLRGRFDLRLKDGAVGEFKTSRSPNAFRYLKRSLQLRAYAFATVELEGTIRPLRLIILRKSLDEDTPQFETLRFTVRDLATLIDTIEKLLLAIDRGEFPRRVGVLCRWCEYRRTCLGGPEAL